MYPYVLVGCAKGKYNLFVRLPGGIGYGQRTLSVEENNPTTELVLQRGHWFSGVIRVAADKALEHITVEVAHPHWTKQTVRLWGTAVPDEAGRFRVFAGDLSQGKIRLVARGTSLGLFAVQDQVENIIDIP